MILSQKETVSQQFTENQTPTICAWIPNDYKINQIRKFEPLSTGLLKRMVEDRGLQPPKPEEVPDDLSCIWTAL